MLRQTFKVVTFLIISVGSFLLLPTSHVLASTVKQNADPFLDALRAMNPNISSEVLNILDDLRYLESNSGGIDSGRSIVCRDMSGYSFGGNSELASSAVKAAIPSLVALLERSHEPEVFIDAANALSSINSKTVPMMATPILEQRLTEESSAPEPDEVLSRSHRSSVPAAAAAALKCIMAKTKDPAGRGYQVLTSDPAAVPTVAEIENRLSTSVENITLLTSSSECLEIEKYDDYGEELSFIAVIGALGESTLLPLIAYLDHEHPMVRIAVARALGENISNSSDVTAPLSTLLLDRCPAVKNEAIISLSDLGSMSQPALSIIVQELANSDASIRANAATAVGNISDGDTSLEIISPLTVLLTDEDIYVRIKAAIALVKMQRTMQPSQEKILDSAVNELFLALQNDDHNVRLTAIKGLRIQGVTIDPVTIDPLNSELISIFASEETPWELRLNAFLTLSKVGTREKSVVQSLIKPFLLKALTQGEPNRYFSPSNVPIRTRIQRINSEEQRQLLSFYESWPIDKRHAFFLTSVEPETFPVFIQSLADILQDSKNDISARYNAAFILGFIANLNSLSQETLNALTSVMNSPDEDFDIRWMSALSLARLGQDVDVFFDANHLPHPLTIDCGTDVFGEGYLFFEPYFGWCEASGSGGEGSSGWAKALERFFGEE